MIPFPNIDPIAFSIPLPIVGELPVRWYALSYLAGIIVGWRVALRLATFGFNGQDDEKTKRYARWFVDEFLFWAVVAIIAGGRIGYVLFYNFDAYLNNPAQMLYLWQGGMSFHGGALGVILTMIMFAWKHKFPVLRLTDIVCAVVPIGLLFGRMANFVNGELYGRVTDAPWGVVFPQAGEEPRHPSQIYEAILEGVVLAVLLISLYQFRSVRDKGGLISGLFLAGYGLGRSFVEQFREPDAHIGFLWGEITMGQLLSWPMIVGGLFLIVWSFIKAPQPIKVPDNFQAEKSAKAKA